MTILLIRISVFTIFNIWKISSSRLQLFIPGIIVLLSVIISYGIAKTINNQIEYRLDEIEEAVKNLQVAVNESASAENMRNNSKNIKYKKDNI